MFTPLKKGATIRKGKTIQPTNLILSWVMCSLLSVYYGRPRSSIQSDFSRRKLKLYDFGHVAFYLSTRPTKCLIKKP